MENFNLSDFVMDFEFDFQNDFTATENQVIDEILTNQIEPNGALNGMHGNPAPFFEYFCDEAVSGLGSAERFLQQQQQQQQMVSIENGMNQAGFDGDVEAPVDEQNEGDIDFDWTTFLQDKSPGQLAPVNEQTIDANDQENPATQDGSLVSANVINDNGSVYQELKTLDVPQIYGNLVETFSLDDLKKLDKCVDFSTLTRAKHPTHQDGNGDGDDAEPILDYRSDPLTRTKVFLMPLQLDPQSNESLQNVASRLKENPTVLNSLLKKCAKSKNANKIEMTAQPKHTKQPSEKYLSVRERMERAATKDIVLPTIKTGSPEGRQRKQVFKIENNKVPIQYAVQIILNDINKSGLFNTSSSSSNSNMETATKNPTKSKKSLSKSEATSKLHENVEAVNEEQKKARRSSKRVKIQ